MLLLLNDLKSLPLLSSPCVTPLLHPTLWKGREGNARLLAQALIMVTLPRLWLHISIQLTLMHCGHLLIMISIKSLRNFSYSSSSV